MLLNPVCFDGALNLRVTLHLWHGKLIIEGIYIYIYTIVCVCPS